MGVAGRPADLTAGPGAVPGVAAGVRRLTRRVDTVPGRMTRKLVLALLTLGLVAPAAASAQELPETLGEIVREQSCRLLVAATGGIADELPADPVLGIPPTWPAAPAGLLPERVDLRTSTESFNRLYDFALRGGNIYARMRAADGTGAGPWRQVPVPPCFAGRVTGIAVDDDELVALDAGNRIYTMDNALKDALLWNWTSRWGTPVWLGPGYALPGGIESWAWTVISPVEDGSWLDPAGNRTRIGDFKVSHIWGLRTGGQRLTFWDPWLPLDESYEMCGPHRGRFKAVSLSASGSQIFLVGARGDLFTRLYDFDISGHNAVFFSYAYENQRGKGDGSPIQLPAEDWVQQPKIPGAITSAISVHKVGKGSIHRVLRVEGEHGGRTGFWERDIADPPAQGWTFHATDRALVGRRLDNPQRDTSREDLGPSEDARFVLRGQATEAEIADYNPYCTPARMRIRDDGGEREVKLHLVDGLRQQVRGRGLDDVPRSQFGAIEHPDGRFEKVTVRATRDALVFEERGWRFVREDPPATGSTASSRACLPRRLAVTAKGIGPVRVGRTRRGLLAAAPSPLRRTASRWTWCVRGGGRVTAAMVQGRVALVASTAKAHALAGARPGQRAATARKRMAVRRASRGVLRKGVRLAGVRGGRVRFVAVTTRTTSRDGALLRKRLRAAGAT